MKKVLSVFLGLILSLVFLIPERSIAQNATSWNNWELVTTLGFGRGGDLSMVMPQVDFVQFKDWYLAFGTSLTGQNGEIRRTQDGITWSLSGMVGLGENNEYIFSPIIYGGFVYIAAYNFTTGAQIWRTFDTENWQKVATLGLNFLPLHLIAFNGEIYAAGLDWLGTGLWKSPNGANSWAEVNDPSASAFSDMIVYKDQLYISYQSVGGGGADIYRTSDGTNWEWVNGRGIDDPHNARFVFSQEFNGDLYVGATKDDNTQAALYRTNNGANWTRIEEPATMNYQTDMLTPSINYNGWMYMVTNTVGGKVEIWRYNGSTWEQVADNGFSDTSNATIFLGNVFNGYLYAGTFNPAGGTIWRKLLGASTTTTDISTVQELPQTGADLNVSIW